MIKNITQKDQEIYIKELKKRTQSKKSALSIKSLQQSGILIRNYLLKNGITPKNITWTGKDNIAGVVSVAKKLRKGRTCKNPATGETIQTEDSYTLSIKAGKSMKEKLNG